MRDVVVVFGKSAEAGKVKTRLSPEVGEETAAKLYEMFARDVFETVLRYRASQDRVDLVLAWEGEISDPLAREATDQGFEYIEQGSGDLGARLERVVGLLRERGAEHLLILGTDSPTLSLQQLHRARRALQEVDVVFGPCFDGGYYLVGLGPGRGGVKGAEAVIFQEIEWSTERVLAQSWGRASEAGLLCDLLSFWYDVDTVEDLKFLHFHLINILEQRDPKVGRYTRRFLTTYPQLLMKLSSPVTSPGVSDAARNPNSTTPRKSRE